MKTVAVILGLVIIVVAVIVVNAPPSDDVTLSGGPPVPITTVFRMLEAENDVVRQLWTQEIVGPGEENGLKFDEDWHDADVEAGPLPALFLRHVGESIQKSPTPLYLFLGSDFPINDANKFTGVQNEYFIEIKRTSMPQFFFDDDVGMHTGMFSDIAVDKTCVNCHNNDPETTKSDWKVGDVMGATTWSYPDEEVSLEEALMLVRTLRRGVRDTYEEYVVKTSTFAEPPTIGEIWPADGYSIPSVDVFMAEAETRASAATLGMIIELQQNEQ